MHLKRLRVSNFRVLDNVDVTFDTKVSVIIGPNAIGKTTVLEAIRLAKAILAPRTQNETNSTLFALGAMSPNLPGRLFPAALSNKPDRPLIIKCAYTLAEEEIAKMRGLAPQLINNIALQSAGLNFSSPAQVVSYLSSPTGQAALTEAGALVDREIKRLVDNRIIELNLTIDFRSGQIGGEFPVQQEIFAAIDRALPPITTLFSYFPADRALPSGEQQVQLGVADTTNQLESYNSQPQLKYQRLKNTIFNSIISGSAGRVDLQKQFQLIFERILRGKDLGEIGVNELGMLSIPIRDLESGSLFQIDGLSSGEKGLILTFLLIAQNVANRGIVLLDEPELHLNPAVCRDLLQFFVDEFAEKKDIQGIICSHSAEILAGSFERASCSLFHLRDGRTLASVRYQDQGEIRDALRRLGSSESEALLYKGSVSVEGIHDVEVLNLGFSDLFRRYRLKDRGGRSQIEKDIVELQKAEGKSEDIGYHYFIFDRDKKPVALRETEHVKFLQLGKYCLENYLIDIEVMTDLSRNSEYSAVPKQTVTAMLEVVKSLALAQLDEEIARIIFVNLGLEDVAFDMRVMRERSDSAVASGLKTQIDRIQTKLSDLLAGSFEKDFVQKVAAKRSELEPIWEEKWGELCNGKRLFEDLRAGGHFKGDLLKLKKAIMSQIMSKKTDTYSALAGCLRGLLGR
jgi:predicted ATPase